MTTAAEPTRLMLQLEAAEGVGDRLAAALEAAPIASVIIRPSPDRPFIAGITAPLVGAGQKAGVAMLIEGDAELARTLRADGVHLPFGKSSLEALEGARSWVGGRAIVGADAGRSRHDAMAFGEHGADFVAFGVPAFVKSRDEAIDRRLDLVAWWAEIFEVPVVAMDVTTLEEARELAAVGADFVCLTIEGGLTLAEIGAFVRDIAGACAEASAEALQARSSD